MKYQHKENGKVITIQDFNEKTKVYLIRFEESGKETNITSSTLKRWYKQVEESSDDAYVAEVMQQKKDLGIECPKIDSIEIVDEDTCADGTTYAEIGKEIAEQAKKKAKEAQKSKKQKAPKRVQNPEVSAIVEYIENQVHKMNGVTFLSDKAPNVKIFKIDGHMFVRINISKKAVNLCCRSKAISVDQAPDKTQNHLFDSIYVLTDLSKTDLIDELLSQSLEYQKAKKNKEVK